MNRLAHLVAAVAHARQRYLDATDGLTSEQATFTPEPGRWSILKITEHLVWAEDVGVAGIWKALDGLRRGMPVWTGEPVHRGLAIEEVVARTWREKEQVPDVAAPRWGGALAFWRAALAARQAVLEDLATALDGHDLAAILYPHPISGPLDARQRLEFLRFHLDRHRAQAEAVIQAPGFQTC